MKVCIVGASGKLGQYMVGHCLDRGWEVVGVCRPESVSKLDASAERMTIYPGRTDDASVIAQAVAGCDAVLTVLVPWGVDDYASGTARAILERADPAARLIFSCGWHITRDGEDTYSWLFLALIALASWFARLIRYADLADQVRATDLIFASDRAWTVVRGSDLEEGPSQGLPVWAEHVGDPVIARNKTRRTDFALFMVEAVDDERLIQEAPAISAPVDERAPVPVASI